MNQAAQLSGGPGAFRVANEPMNQNLVVDGDVNAESPMPLDIHAGPANRLSVAGDAVIHGGSNGGQTVVTMQHVIGGAEQQQLGGVNDFQPNDSGVFGQAMIGKGEGTVIMTGTGSQDMEQHEQQLAAMPGAMVDSAHRP